MELSILWSSVYRPVFGTVRADQPIDERIALPRFAGQNLIRLLSQWRGTGR